MSTPTDETQTHLQQLAAQIATPEGAAGLVNDNGAKYWKRSGGLKRASNAVLSYRGVELSIDYWTEGGFGADAYVDQIKSIEIGGVECLEIFSEEQIGDLCERIQQSWDREVGV